MSLLLPVSAFWLALTATPTPPGTPEQAAVQPLARGKSAAGLHSNSGAIVYATAAQHEVKARVVNGRVEMDCIDADARLRTPDGRDARKSKVHQ